MTQEQIATNEGAFAFHAFEWAFFGICKVKMLTVSMVCPSSRRNATTSTKRGTKRGIHLRDLSCLLRCSLRLNARLQNWHLYFFSGAPPALRVDGEAEAVCITAVAAGIKNRMSRYGGIVGDFKSRTICLRRFKVLTDG